MFSLLVYVLSKSILFDVKSQGESYFENSNVGGKSVGKKELEKFLKEFTKILHL